MDGKAQYTRFDRPPLDPVNLTIGWLVFAVSLVVYTMTCAVTVPFWDCGEFITCSYVLGIPHPPGTPLYVLAGRLFSMLPIAEDISMRVNWLSSFCSAGTAMVAYFFLSRLITGWHSEVYAPQRLSAFKRLSVYAGAFSGSLFLAFSNTNWANSVEAEVYGAAMFLFMVLLWLGLVWHERRHDPRSDKLLIAMSYIAVLSIGIHMTVFMAMPPIFLLIVMAAPRLRREWRFWVTGVVLLLVMHEVDTFLWPATIWLLVATCGHYWPSIQRGWVAVPIAVVGAGSGYAIMIGESWPIFLSAFTASLILFVFLRMVPQRRMWMLAHTILLAGLLGYTVQAYTPIRSVFNPVIDENDPENWATFKGFLERKQYGRESMFERALHRRGEWANQFGQHQRMGFWGFFDRQYGYNDIAFLPFFVLGMFGLAYAIRRKWKRGAVIFLLLLMTSVGLVWYMNFADGTQYDPIKQDAYLEVRDRDYFFTPAFILFGAAMGLGVAALISIMGASADESKAARPLRWLALGVGGALAFLPIRTLEANYYYNNRSNDYIAYDYAYNILQSADENAILFTNGDNDTFPVWCLQEVYGIRPDVKIANLSLINTHWYIKQIKNRLGVPISYTDERIDQLAHVMTPEGEIYRLQDRMIDDIMSTNNWKYPINFAITVPESNRKYQMRGIEKNLMMIGMAYRVVPDTGISMVDADVMHHKFWNVFQFRSVNDPDVHKTESAERLVANYASGFLFTAEARRQEGDFAQAEREALRAMEVLPNEWQPYVYLAQLAVDMKKPENLEMLMDRAMASRADLGEIIFPVYSSYDRLGDRAGGQSFLKRTLQADPHNTDAFRTLVRSYFQERNYDTLYAVLREWVANNPADTQSVRMFNELQRQLDVIEMELEPVEPSPETEDAASDSW